MYISCSIYIYIYKNYRRSFEYLRHYIIITSPRFNNTTVIFMPYLLLVLLDDGYVLEATGEDMLNRVGRIGDDGREKGLKNKHRLTYNYFVW